MTRRIIVVGLLAVLLAGLAVFFLAYHREGFTGESVKNGDSYTLDIQRMNGTARHTLELTAEDVLQIEFETEKGSLHLEIKAPDGATLYAGNGREITNFEIHIFESGAYSIMVEARHAKGRLSIHRKGDISAKQP